MTDTDARRPLTGGVRVEPMTTAHLAHVMQHETELFGSEAWSIDSYRDELADRRHRWYVVAVDEADDAGALVGWAGLLVIAGTAQVLTIGVVSAAQRRGIGQLLLDALLGEAVRRGADEVILEVRVDNPAARRLYDRNRFTPLRTRRGYYDLGRVDALEMRRAL